MLDGRIFFEADALQFEGFVRSDASLALTKEQAAYLTEFLRRGARDFVKNATAIRTAVAIVGRTVVPLVINDGSRSNECYLVSPYVHYVAYMRDEVKKMKPLWLTSTIRGCLSTLGVMFRQLHFDKAVSINNWLFTTCPRIEPSAEEVASLKTLLVANFPDHALVYRGLDLRDGELAASLQRSAFHTLIHRPIFEWSARDFASRKMPKKARDKVKCDLKLSQGRPFTSRQAARLSGDEADRMASLYEALYIRKHSRYNAHYTPAYFDAVLATGVNSASWLHLGGEPVGFVTLCLDSHRVIASLVGYDPAVATSGKSVYAALIAEGFRRALELERVLFLSTGVAHFKSVRGAREVMEYEAFHVEHLPRHRRLPWFTIKAFLDALIGSMDTKAI